jgi:hypothetical protein
VVRVRVSAIIYVSNCLPKNLARKICQKNMPKNMTEKHTLLANQKAIAPSSHG